MTMYVLIEGKPHGKFTASLLGSPAIQAQAASQQEALAQLREIVSTQIGQGTIVPIEIETEQQHNPWLRLGDALQNNPLLDDVTEAIQAHRHELNSRAEAA